MNFGKEYFIYKTMNDSVNIIITIKIRKKEVALFCIDKEALDEKDFSEQHILKFLNFLIKISEKIEFQNKSLKNMKLKEEQEKMILLAFR